MGKNENRCIFCGETADTREHVFAKCFFEKPYPKNMMTVPTCHNCNQSFSLDEQYLLYLIEYLRSIEENFGDPVNELAERTYRHCHCLEKRMLSSLKIDNKNNVYFQIEAKRINRVVLKIASCLIFLKKNVVVPIGQLHCSWAMKSQVSIEQFRAILKIRFNILQERKVKYYFEPESKEVGFCIGEFFYACVKYDGS